MFSVKSEKPKAPPVDERVGESGILLADEAGRGRLVDTDRAWFGCMIFFRIVSPKYSACGPKEGGWGGGGMVCEKKKGTGILQNPPNDQEEMKAP